MPRLILLDGPTGAGKSTLLNYFRSDCSAWLDVGTKLTTRPRRVTDNNWEFKFVDQIPDTSSYCVFESIRNMYAIDLAAISNSINNGRWHVISCVDRDAMVRLSAAFPTSVIYIYRPLSPADLEHLIQSRGEAAKHDAIYRRQELELVPADYAQKLDLYDHVLLNIASPADLIGQIRVLIKVLANRT